MKEFDFDFKLEGGSVVVVAKYEGAGMSSELVNKVKAEYFIEKLKALIPGDMDDKVLDLLKLALLK